MNSPEHPTSAQAGSVVTIDAIFVAQQFERINTTLEFFGRSIDSFTVKEKEQDNQIAGIRSDIAEMKADLRSLRDEQKEASSERNSKKVPWTAVGALVTSIVAVVLLILNGLYGA